MQRFPRPNLFFSKCLGFDNCRYNGQMITDSFVENVKTFVNNINTCPEMSIGLQVPRDPIRVISENNQIRLYDPKTEKDYTKEMNEFAHSYLNKLYDIDGFLLKSKSPSCGHKNVKIYNGTSKVSSSSKGTGIFADKIKDLFPYAPIEDEGRLHNFRIRNDFLTRIFLNADFRQVRESNFLDQLLHFHNKNKLLFMANSQKYTKILNKIIDSSSKKGIEQTFNEYKEALNLVFKRLPRCTNNINVLIHAMSYFSKYITQKESDLILDALEKYQMRKFTIYTPMLLVKSYIIRFNITYLLEQTYFAPYPDDLIILEDSEKIQLIPE